MYKNSAVRFIKKNIVSFNMHIEVSGSIGPRYCPTVENHKWDFVIICDICGHIQP
jgi:hypothetical protein